LTQKSLYYLLSWRWLVYVIRTVKIYARTDCCQGGLKYFQVQLLDSDGTLVASNDYDTPAFAASVTISFEDIDASQVKVQMKHKGFYRTLYLAEVKVFSGVTLEAVRMIHSCT